MDETIEGLKNAVTNLQREKIETGNQISILEKNVAVLADKTAHLETRLATLEDARQRQIVLNQTFLQKGTEPKKSIFNIFKK